MRNKSILFFALVKLTSFAQQEVQFTQYMFNINAVNPAYTGSREAISATVLHRNQWVGFNGAPVTQSINVNTPFLNDKLGIGVTVMNEKIGPLKQTGAFADFAYRIKFTQSTLAFGLKAGADVFQAGLNNLNLINNQDNQFQNNFQSKYLPNFGFGIYLHSLKYYLGLSTPKLVQNNINIQAGNSVSSQISVNQLHYYLIGGYVVGLNQFIKFKPTFQLKMTYGSPLSLDANANFLFYEKFWIGSTWRFGDAIALTMQLQLDNQLRIGYSYDVSTSKLSRYNNGSHEIMLGYDLKFKKEKIRSPRYF